MNNDIFENMKKAGLEERKAQVDMINVMHDLLLKDSHIIVEAQTGTGKTLSYLLSSLQAAKEKELKGIIVTTKTKILQDQLLKKDIPLAKKIFGNFSAKVLYGSQEYVCLNTLDSLENVAPVDVRMLKEKVNKCMEVVDNDESGDTQVPLIDDFSEVPITMLKLSEIVRDPETCKGVRCPYFNRDCLYYREYRAANKQQVLVINHYLFLTNIETCHKLFKPADICIIDEAHAMEDICIDFWGKHLSFIGISKFFKYFFNPQKDKRGLRYKLKRLNTEIRQSNEFFGMIADLQGLDEDIIINIESTGAYASLEEGLFELETFVEEKALGPLKKMFTDNLHIYEKGYNQSGEISLNYICDLCEILKDILNKLIEIFLRITLTCSSANDQDLETFVKKIKSTYNIVAFFIAFRDNYEIYKSKYVIWFETEEKGRAGLKNIQVHASPLTVADAFKENVLSKFGRVALVSATLGINGDFEYIKSMLGMEESPSICLKSDFDLANNQFIFIPMMQSTPNSNEFLEECVGYTFPIVDHFNGRTLVLTTSHYNLNHIYKMLKESGRHVIRQGEMDRTELLKYKRENEDSTLVGTSSLWEGIDIKGDALKCVIIVKLPFDVPSDPLFAARSRFFDSLGKNSFMYFSLPRALIRLKQGVGRLIRSKDDSGLVVIMDPRIINKSYGKKFLHILEGKYLNNLSELEVIK